MHPESRSTADIVRTAIAGIGKAPAAAAPPLDATFTDLGIDSLDFVRLVQEIEDGLDIRLSDEQAAAVVTVGDLIALCETVAGTRDTGPA